MLNILESFFQTVQLDRLQDLVVQRPRLTHADVVVTKFMNLQHSGQDFAGFIYSWYSYTRSPGCSFVRPLQKSVHTKAVAPLDAETYTPLPLCVSQIHLNARGNRPNVWNQLHGTQWCTQTAAFITLLLHRNAMQPKFPAGNLQDASALRRDPLEWRTPSPMRGMWFSALNGEERPRRESHLRGATSVHCHIRGKLRGILCVIDRSFPLIFNWGKGRQERLERSCS